MALNSHVFPSSFFDKSAAQLIVRQEAAARNPAPHPTTTTMAFNQHHPHHPQLLHSHQASSSQSMNPHHPHDLLSLASFTSTLTAAAAAATSSSFTTADDSELTSAGAFENLAYGNHFFSSGGSGNHGCHYGSNGSLVSCSTNSTLTSTTAADAFTMPEDVIKYGKMRKLKVGFKSYTFITLQITWIQIIKNYKSHLPFFFVETRHPALLCPPAEPPRGEEPHQPLLLRQ